MNEKKNASSVASQAQLRRTRRAPTNSFVYERILPIVFIALGFVMLALVLFAAGVLLGFVRYQ